MVDEKQIVYSKESLVDIVADNNTGTLGTVDISGGQITLGPKSSVSYEYNYETGQDSSIITDILQLDCSVIGLTDGMTTRYNRYLSILIKVQYYLEIVEGDTKTYYDGNTDTFEIYPYLSHESNNTLYNIALQNSYIKKITITYKNDYESDSVKYTNIKLKYSMSLLEAIDKYGGGSPFVPGSNSLKFYSVDDKYSIDSYGDSLIMKVDIDENNWEEVVKPYIKPTESVKKESTMIYKENGLNYPFDLNNPITQYTAKIRWTVRSKNDNGSAFSTSVYGNEQIVYVKEDRDLSDEEKARLRSATGSVYDREYNRILKSGDCWSEMKVSIESRYCKIIGYKTDTLVVRAEYIDAPNIYFEQEVKINNCSVVDFKLTFDDNDMEIHGSEIQFATLEVIPSNIKYNGNQYAYAANLSCISYDEMNGKASLIGDDGSEYSSLNFKTLPARIKVKGRNNGKVLFTAKTYGLYPTDFSKSWIAEVFDVPEYRDLYTKVPNGTVIDATKEYIDIIVGINGNYSLSWDHSDYGLESLDGAGKGYITLLTKYNTKELTYRIYPLTPGKIKFWGNMDKYGIGYIGRVEVEVNITALYKELTTEITTNTGLFEITEAAGQLEVYCTPNYSYAGDYSFSQVSIDGGSVSISDKGNYALITADREGKLNLICKPDRGKSVQCEISVSNQYPKDVKLVTADGVFKVALGGNLMIYAEAGNKPNSNYEKYSWVFEKLDNHASCNTEIWDKYTKITGKTEGKIRVSAVRKIDSKLMTSEIVEIVTTLDESGKIYVPYPKYEYEYFVIYRRPEKNNVLWLVEIDDTSGLDRLILKNDTLYSNVVHGNCEEFELENLLWASQYTWTNNDTVGSFVGELIASNLDIYNSSGKLIMNKIDNYYDIDFSLVYDKRNLLVIPADSKYWILYRSTDKNELWLVTIGGEVELNKLTKKSDNKVYTDNITFDIEAKYYVKDYYWFKFASLTTANANSVGPNVGTIYASNLDIYDESGNLLIAKTEDYSTLDLEAILAEGN